MQTRDWAIKKRYTLLVLAFSLLSLAVSNLPAYAEEHASSVPEEEKAEPKAEEEPPPKPIDPFLIPSDDLVKGFQGEARTLAKQWFQKQKLFTSIEFLSGSLGKFWDKGTLVGRMKNGNEVLIEISDDFSRDNPDMILDHLRVLEYRADISVFNRQEWKKHMMETRELQRKIEQANVAFDKKIEKIIKQRLLRHMKDQLSSADRGTIENARSDLELILTRKVTQQIEGEVKRKFPRASEAKVAGETDKKIALELGARVKNMVNDYILDEKLDYEGTQGEARTIIHNYMLKYKKPIVAKVKKDYGPLRRKDMSDLVNKIEEEKKRREKAESSILGQLKKQFQSIKTDWMGLLPFGKKDSTMPQGAGSAG